MPTVTGQNVYIASDSVNFRTGEVTKANISYNSGSDKLFFSGDLVFQDPTASITGRLEVSHIEVTGAHNPWAGTDAQYGAIYLSDEGRGLLGNFGGDYARPMITANSNKLTIGSNGTSIIRDIDVHPGNGAGAAMSNFNVFTSGVKRMTVTRTGNIGFGGGLADNPSKAFVVDLQDSRMDILNGSVKIRYAPNNDALTLTPSVGNEARILAADTDTSSAHPLKIAADQIRFTTSGSAPDTEVMRITSDGKVGIGTDDPTTAKLRIKGTTNDSSELTLQCIDSTDTQTFFVRNDGVVQVTDNYFYVSSNAGAYVQHDLRVRGSLSNDGGALVVGGDVNFDVNTLFVDSTNDRVGIGTNTPRTTLHVSKAGTTEGGIITIDNPNNTDGSYCGIEFINSAVGYPRSAIFAQRTGGYDAELTFHTSDTNQITGSDYPDATERMRIDHDGNVGIGTNNPARKLDVSTNAADAYGIRNSYNASYYMEMAHNRFNAVGNNYIRFNIDDATKMTIVDSDFGGGVNGVGIGITSPTTELQVIGTISGVSGLFGSAVGIGTNDPSNFNGAARRLVVGGGAANEGITIFAGNSSASSLYLADGTAGDQAYRGYITYSHSAEKLSLGAGGITRITATNAGLVGIGTASPSGSLDVGGDGADIFLHSNDFKIARIQPRGSSTNYDRGLFSLFNQTVEAVRIDSYGPSWFNSEVGNHLGIGTVSPNKQVEIRAVEPYLRLEESSSGGNKRLDLFVSSSTGVIAANQSAQTMMFQTVGENRMTIEAGGDVGIGTTNPAYRLDVIDSDGGTLARFKDSDSSHAGLIIQGDTNGGTITNAAGFTSEVIYLQNSANAMRFYTDATEAVRIDSSQRVGIGTNSPTSNLHINGRNLVEGPTVPSTLAISDSGDATKNLRLGYEPTWDVGSISASDLGAGWKDIVIAPIAGSVGIGTTNPPHTLSVKGTISRLNSSSIQVANLQVSSEAGQLLLNNAGGVAKALINSNGASYIIGGNFGINVTDPDSTLEVAGKTHLGGRGQDGGATIAYATLSETNGGAATILGNAVYAGAASNTFRKTYNDAGNFIKQVYSKGITFHTNVTGNAGSTEYSIDGYEKMRIDLAGNVGIGTNAPSQLLDVSGDAAFAQYLYHQGDEDTNIKFVDDDFMINVGGATFFRATETAQNTIKLNSDSEDTDFYLYGNHSTPALFMRGSDREVGINTTNPTASLHVVGNAAIVGASSDGILTLTNAAASQVLRIDQNSIRTTTNNNLTLFSNGRFNNKSL
jgi:hypothetical protein